MSILVGMMSKNFVDAYLRGDAALSDVDSWVEAWHLSSTELSLDAFLGLTPEEGKVFAEHPEQLHAILRSRTN